MVTTAIPTGGTYREFWPSRVELNRARAAREVVAQGAMVRIGLALVAWGRRTRGGSALEPYLSAHEERMALVAATRHAGLPFG